MLALFETLHNITDVFAGLATVKAIHDSKYPCIGYERAYVDTLTTCTHTATAITVLSIGTLVGKLDDASSDQIWRLCVSTIYKYSSLYIITDLLTGGDASIAANVALTVGALGAKHILRQLTVEPI